MLDEGAPEVPGRQRHTDATPSSVLWYQASSQGHVKLPLAYRESPSAVHALRHLATRSYVFCGVRASTKEFRNSSVWSACPG
jgi:hypothetical protein